MDQNAVRWQYKSLFAT